MTYNHAPIIDQALVSVLDQETRFDFEIIVSEERAALGESIALLDSDDYGTSSQT